MNQHLKKGTAYCSKSIQSKAKHGRPQTFFQGRTKIFQGGGPPSGRPCQQTQVITEDSFIKFRHLRIKILKQ